MVILVPDTPILIDLDRGSLLDAVFSCGLTMVVPDLLYDRELELDNGPFLRKLGLGVVALTPNEVAYAQRFKAERKNLSLPDCFALGCATRANHVLVTGNCHLSSEAIARLGKVYGLFWVLDRMAESGMLSNGHLYDGLTRIAAHPSCHLLLADVRARLNSWAPS